MSATGTAMVDNLVEAFRSRFGDSKKVEVCMAPGRVNLIGDHTDYNDGFVLPMTVDRGVYLAARTREGSTVRISSVRYNEFIEYELDRIPRVKPGSWSSYMVGVVEELRLRGLLDTGFEAVVDGNLVLGAGLSSSAALEVATAVTLQRLTGFDMEPVDMVKLCQHVEHNYANVLCGIMDQFACRIGRQGHALFLDCRSLDYESIPVTLGDYRIVIISSGVKRSLASSAYNTRRAECQQGVDYFSALDDNIGALRDVSGETLENKGDGLPENIRRRCRHVVTENRRVSEAVTALSGGDLARFGELMNASHDSLRDDFEVSCRELDVLVKLARETEGVLGARMTGAGFGGCTVNLVHEDAVAAYSDRLAKGYAAIFESKPGVFVLTGNLEAGPVTAAQV